MTHKQVIVVRKDLNMRKGKMVAQGAHASMAVILDAIREQCTYSYLTLTTSAFNDPRIQPWLDGPFKKICVSVDSEAELLAIHEKAKELGILTSLIRDSGLTEFGGVPTYTTVAVGPDTEENVNKVTAHLKLL